MSFLKDKEWDEMDWLNKAVEPYTFSLNTELVKIPSNYTLTYHDILYHLKKNDISMQSVLLNIASKFSVSDESIAMLDYFGHDNIFEIQIDGSPEISLDEMQIKYGSVSLVKKTESLTDDLIKQTLPKFVHYMLRIDRDKAEAAFLNDTMDILDCKEGRNSSSIKVKISSIFHHVAHIYENNLWNIRNVDLLIKKLRWIKSFCEKGDRCSIANLSKLKCMIYGGHPIYSMEEIR